MQNTEILIQFGHLGELGNKRRTRVKETDVIECVDGQRTPETTWEKVQEKKNLEKTQNVNTKNLGTSGREIHTQTARRANGSPQPLLR